MNAGERLGSGSMRAPDGDAVAAAASTAQALAAAIETVLLGKADVIETALICLLSEGHLLLDDVPGVGKTVLAKTLAGAFGGQWSRVQFTPDLMPSDITGVSVWQPKSESFTFRPGPLFSSLVVCDEINRGPARTQAALLESMEERTVTVDGTTYALARPFVVVATQNPYEQEGTYTLPESQLDRFLVRTSVGYPGRDAELQMLASGGAAQTLPDLGAVTTVAQITDAIDTAGRIFVSPVLLGYIADLVRATRTHPEVSLGASPRAALALCRASRSQALLRGRAFATPDDVQSVVHRVLDHRVLARSTRRWSRDASSSIVTDVVSRQPVPSARSTSFR